MNKDNFYEETDKRTGERRKFVRVNANFVISYFTNPNSSEIIKDMTLTRNISINGICFTTDRNFSLGTILEISLRLPKVTKLIELIAKVVYSEKVEKTKSIYNIGVKLIQAQDEDLYILEKIIKECASAEKKIYFNVKERRKETL